nr:hypothetical protein [Leptospira interrogans]
MNPEEKAKLLETLDLILKHLQSQSSNSGSDYKVVLYLVPIFGIVFGSALLFFVFYWWYRQRIEIIKAGLYKKETFDLRTYSFFLSLILTFVGIALSIGFISVLGQSLAMLGGLVPLGTGLGLLCYYKFSQS